MTARSWDILIVTIPHRHERLCALLASLDTQMRPGVTVRIYRDNLQALIGDKRQALLESADAGYVSFIDDDDQVAGDFIPRVCAALGSEPDYVGFPVLMRRLAPAAVQMVMEMSGPRHDDHNAFWPPPGGVLQTSAEEAAGLVARGWAIPADPADAPGTLIEHSLRHAAWAETPQSVTRDLSHMNPVRRELALLGSFAGLGYAEDRAWAAQVRATGMVRTEAWIPDPMYFYFQDEGDGSKTPRQPLAAMPPLPSYPWLKVI